MYISCFSTKNVIFVDNCKSSGFFLLFLCGLRVVILYRSVSPLNKQPGT